jgi:hypothetical protein
MDINQYSEQYFKFISDHFINTIATQVNHKVLENIAIEVNKFNIAEQINQQIDHVVANAIAAYRSADLAGAAAVGQNLVAQFKTESENFIQQLTADVRTKVIEEYRHKVHEIDIVEMIKDQCNILVKQAVETGTLNFPHNSIPSSAIKNDTLSVNANNILPGIIKKFSSTGIQDLSNDCQVTITDQFTIFENKVLAQDLEVQGEIKVSPEGAKTLSDMVAGLAVAKIEKTYSDGTFDQYVHRVLYKLNEEGIAVDKIKIRDKPLIQDGTILNPNIINSNLRKLGLLSELEVDGESLLDNTLYVRSGKIGLNTTDPLYTVDIWDQEVQFIATKHDKNSMFLGTVKPQKIIFGTNTQDQLTLSPDGNIYVERITIGKITQSTAAFEPSDNRQIGEIVWNEQPAVGMPIGWVSLGGARWAKFGIITE